MSAQTSNARNTRATPRPKVDLDATVDRLSRLVLAHAAERLSERLAEATKDELPAHGVLDRLLDDELTDREERRVKTSLHLSGAADRPD